MLLPQVVREPSQRSSCSRIRWVGRRSGCRAGEWCCTTRRTAPSAMLAVELRSERSRSLPQNQICSGELTVLGLELEDPRPVADLVTGGNGSIGRVLARATPRRRAHGRRRGLGPPNPPPQRLGMDVELAGNPSDRSSPGGHITTRIQRQPCRARSFSSSGYFRGAGMSRSFRVISLHETRGESLIGQTRLLRRRPSGQSR